jgi:hypothetical protein
VLSLVSDYGKLNTLSLVSDLYIFQILIMKKTTFGLDVYSYQIDTAGQFHNTFYIDWMEIGRLRVAVSRSNK